MSAPTLGRGLVEAVGLEGVQRDLARIQRRVDREAQKSVMKAARKTLLPAIRSEAPSQSDRKTGMTMRRAVTVRRGRKGTVLLGPRGGKRGVWFRHITIGGSRRHELGAPKSSGIRVFYSKKKATRHNPLGAFARAHAAKGRAFMGNRAAGIHAVGPWSGGGNPADPFVQRGADRAFPAYMQLVADDVFSMEETKE